MPAERIIREAADAAIGQHPEPFDLGRIAIERAFIQQAVLPAAGAVIGLAEGDGLPGDATIERGIDSQRRAAAAKHGFMSEAAET